MLISIDKIIIKDRIRKDFGNIEELAEDIKQNGLINPPVVIPEKDGTFTLLTGERRVRALKSLGKTDIEVRTWITLSDEEKINIEISENEVRKDFSKAERIEYARRLERIESLKARGREMAGVNPVENFPQGKTRDIVAEKLNIGSGKQYEKEKTIVDNKSLLDPTDFAEWDEGKLSTNKAFQKIKAELEKEKEKVKELESKPQKTVVKEVAPDDYTQVKKDFAYMQSQYEEMAKKWKNSEAEKRKLIQEKEDPQNKQSENIRKSALMFNAGIANFIENYGGYIWLTGYLDYMTETEKKGFLSGVNALEAWIYQMKTNLGGNENE